MSLTLTLVDHEIPVSPAFIEFLYSNLTGTDYYDGKWFNQQDEAMHWNPDRFKDIQEKAKIVFDNPEGQQLIVRAYRLFKEMLIGRPVELRELTSYRFFFVTGIPRTGGTYITKQLFRAANIDYTKIQNSLAHDAFPHLARLKFVENSNTYTNGLLQLSEYLTMVDVFFKEHGNLSYQGNIVVPKKFTKSVYYFDLIRELFGEKSNYIVTLRHPLSVIQSLLDKAGGMPKGRKYGQRSAIESWALDDWTYWGVPEKQVRSMNYVEVMCGYWKRYHYQMALSGMVHMPTTQLIPYSQQNMTEAAKSWYKEFDVDIEPEPFKVAKSPKFKPEEEKLAEKTLEEVASFWNSLGLKFPLEQLKERN